MSLEPSDSTNRAWVSEDEAHRLLARAAELDSHIGATLSVDQLRDIAAEAGIGPDAFEMALRELDARRRAGAEHERSANVGRRATNHRLVERLTRHRAVAAVAIFVGAALATPGDLIWTTLIVSAPAYALYELGIAVARSRISRSGSPPASPANDAGGSPRNRPPLPPASRTTRSLLLRTS
jgi:hypothetical protein